MKKLPYLDPGTPDLRGPWHYLAWTGKGQWRTLAGAASYGSLWMLAQALVPAAVSLAIDRGMIAHNIDQLLLWSAAVLLLAATSALSGMMRHRYAVESWMRATFRVIQLIGRHAVQTGEALPRTTPTGKVVATVASDAVRVGNPFDVFGRFCASILSFLVVAIILLTSSVRLGLIVLIGVPVLLAALTLVMRPLQRKQAAQREESGHLTELGSDTVAGLRVLRGIGGETTFLRRYQRQSQSVRRHGVDVANPQATLEAAEVLLPGIFIVVVTWLGARAVFDGSISPGQLVAFFGYTAFLVMPLRTATEMAEDVARAVVAARKVIDVLKVHGDHDDSTAVAELPDGPREIADATSGVRIRPGRLTAVVSARPHESTDLADRLGRFGPEARGVTYGGVDLLDVPLAQVRSRITVSETDPRLFTGSLRGELDPTGRADDVDLLAALEVADAGDVLDALPGGLDAEVEERGRSFSGGQRQRLALARALLLSAETLVLVEPTSAVDAHTEARIAGRLAGLRRGRTTVVMTASPLLLDHVDEVVFCADGVQVARGTHAELLAHDPAYRRVVTRGADETMEVTPS